MTTGKVHQCSTSDLFEIFFGIRNKQIKIKNACQLIKDNKVVAFHCTGEPTKSFVLKFLTLNFFSTKIELTELHQPNLSAFNFGPTQVQIVFLEELKTVLGKNNAILLEQRHKNQLKSNCGKLCMGRQVLLKSDQSKLCKKL